MLTNVGDSTARSESIFPKVNGFPVEPVFTPQITYGAGVNCPALTTANVRCAATGTWWLDIDAAEAAHPGQFVKQPLNIVLIGQELTGHGDIDLVATLTARVQNK
jgi:hypothetical protein